MVTAGKADLQILNSYLKDYYNLIFGTISSIGTAKDSKEELTKRMEGFRALFGREKITFKPKVGSKLTGDINNLSFEELMKSEKK